MNQLNKAIGFALIILLGCNPETETKVQKDPFTQLTEFSGNYAQRTLSYGNVNSMSVAIYRNGKSYHNYFGKQSSSVPYPPSDSSLFEIASITKTFTGSLVARAVLENKISLESDIRDFLPKDYPNLEYKGKPVTIKHLVTHTIGFETPPKLDSVYQQIFSGAFKGVTISYDISDLLTELETVELQHEPGTFYDYNNVGPEIAAYILEQVNQKPFSEQLIDFFEEVGMENTYLQDYEKHKDKLVLGHTETGETATIDENPVLGGASGIITTLPDLARFMKYELESTQPFIKESRRTLFEDEDEEVGYFWDLGYAEVEGFFCYKSGTSNGTQSIMLLCPDSDYGLILIMNNTSEEATNDWVSLYNKTEYDLIQFPKLNLWTKLESSFFENPKAGTEKYLELMKDTAQYFFGSDYLNSVGYDYIFHDEILSAIEVFKLALAADQENANLHDSMGEAYFLAEDYEKSKRSFERSLELNPENGNAVDYLDEIEKIMEGSIKNSQE